MNIQKMMNKMIPPNIHIVKSDPNYDIRDLDIQKYYQKTCDRCKYNDIHKSICKKYNYATSVKIKPIATITNCLGEEYTQYSIGLLCDSFEYMVCSVCNKEILESEDLDFSILKQSIDEKIEIYHAKCYFGLGKPKQQDIPIEELIKIEKNSRKNRWRNWFKSDKNKGWGFK